MAILASVLSMVGTIGVLLWSFMRFEQIETSSKPRAKLLTVCKTR